MMNSPQIINWLLEGDVAIQYQVHRDLLDDDRPDLQKRIALEGWGKEFLARQHPDGHWGDRFYQPKWISTHYTLLDLRNLSVDPDNKAIRSSINQVIATSIAEDGGIQLGPSTSHRSDVCVNGMFLNYASYFRIDEHKLLSLVDSLLGELMPDGGFNCRTTRSGAVHSSLHSTISVLEGLASFQRTESTYRQREVTEAKASAEEFILLHQLFKSDHTGKIIHKDFLRLPFPSRWRYDILRALDYFQDSNREWDERMRPAIDVILEKQDRSQKWKLNAGYPGQVHFAMEKAGQPSRWNTLRALRVLRRYEDHI